MAYNEKKRLKVYLFKIDLCSHAKMSSFARSKVLSLAAKDLNVSKKSVEIKSDMYRKPYIAGFEKWYFNISHTPGMIGIAVSEEPVGIDVEKVRDADFRIAKRFFTAQENFHIENATNKEKCFFEIWTKKEAYLKYTGRGLNDSLKSFDVFEQSHRIESFEEDGYMISVCHDSIRELKMSIERYDLTL